MLQLEPRRYGRSCKAVDLGRWVSPERESARRVKIGEAAVYGVIGDKPAGSVGIVEARPRPAQRSAARQRVRLQIGAENAKPLY